MKTHFYTFTILLLNVYIANAQTPFDSYDSTMAQITIHKAQTVAKFTIPVQDSTGKVAYLQFDIEEKQLAYYNAKDSLVDMVVLNDEQLKFLSVDPLTSKYPELTPYQFASNTPIQAIDLDGLEMSLPGNSYNTQPLPKLPVMNATDIQNMVKNASSSLSNYVVQKLEAMDKVTASATQSAVPSTVTNTFRAMDGAVVGAKGKAGLVKVLDKTGKNLSAAGQASKDAGGHVAVASVVTIQPEGFVIAGGMITIGGTVDLAGKGFSFLSKYINGDYSAGNKIVIPAVAGEVSSKVAEVNGVAKPVAEYIGDVVENKVVELMSTPLPINTTSVER